MPMFSIALAPLLALQAAGQTPVAIKNDTPETWTVEYPRIITPFIQDYRRCLNVVNRMVSGEANLEEQHRSDIPRCAETSATAQSEANRILANRGELEDYSPDDVAEVFAHIGRIHIARGADLDAQFISRMASAERAETEYNETKPKGLVMDLLDASVVKSAIDQSQKKTEDASK